MTELGLLTNLVIKIVIYTISIVVLIFVCKYVAEYVKKNDVKFSKKKIKIIERVALSRERELILLEYENKIYFLSSCSSGTTIIKETDVDGEKEI